MRRGTLFLWAAVQAAAQVSPTMFLMQQASGTSANPAAAPMDMIHIHKAPWMYMLHGTAFVTEIVQTGPRGADRFLSTNWFMASAMRSAGGGELAIRAMLSLEPATVIDRSYPLLFQTGETGYGRPLIDAQHPH